MATGQTVLDTMELLNQELQLQSGEADVTRALVAVNRAIDYLEAELAKFPDVMGDTTGTVTTTASTEATAYPAGVLRLDRLQLLDDTTSLPIRDLVPIKRAGGHRAWGWRWPLMLGLNVGGPGRPYRYWTDGRNIYWLPLPDATYTVRWYGLKAADDINAAATYPYPDITILPVASFATMLMRLGVDDPVSDISGLASSTFLSAIKTLRNFDRDGAAPFEYDDIHHT